MANPHYDQQWREAVNEDREETHEVGNTGPHDRSAGNSRVRGDEWRREHNIDESERGQGNSSGETDQHHHHHHHHHGSEGHQSGHDYEQLAEKAHDRIRHGRRGQGKDELQHVGRGSQQGHDFGDDESNHSNRHGSRGEDDLGTSRSPRIEGRQSGGHVGQQSSHRDQGRQQSGGRRYGQRRQLRGRGGTEHGSPHEGSQRGSDREEGLSGRMMGQRGETTHHSDPSDSTFREKTSGQREHRHGGERGTSQRDRRFGSRRGHGSERHTDERPSSQ